jgi:glycerophosphoryl diester phosphodiesterase
MAMRRPIVIAHRGASGYLPEHSLPAKALAHGMGADYLEQDVVLSRDGVPLILHDLHLDAVTDAARRWPGRARPDGHRYAIDFDLAELLALEVHERTDPATGRAVFPGRFPVPDAAGTSPFRLHTLDQELTLIRGLAHSTGRPAGIYLELKEPAWHEAQGQDLAAAVLPILDRHGCRGPDDAVFIQCFEPRTLQRLHADGCRIPLIQLIGEPHWWAAPPADFAAMQSPAGLAGIARYGAGIGPWIGQILLGPDGMGGLRIDDLVARAQGAGLLVHPYSFRQDALPPGIESFEALLALFVDRLGIDGLFTDFPDLAVRWLEARAGG